jgi:NAD-dependent deacetylase
LSEAPPDPLAQIFRDAHRILFVTGAGLSADSGLPTYRGVAGLYENRDADIPVEVAMSGPMFERHPEVTWRHIRVIEEAGRTAEPNPGHAAIAALEHHREVVVLTQNVDGLHARAGSSRVIEIHGNALRLRCTGCAWTDKVSDYTHLPPLPRCERCSGVVRPDVVLFEEMLPAGAVADLRRELLAGFDAVVSVGTSSLFPYISEPVLRAAAAGTPTAEINPADTDLSGFVALRVRERAAVALQRAFAAFEALEGSA